MVALLSFSCLGAIAGCTPNSGAPAPVTVGQNDPHTVIVTQNPDGTFSRNDLGDPELVGKKVVQIGVRFEQAGELSSHLLTFWRAGNKAGAQTIEDSPHSAQDPGPNGAIVAVVRKEIPGSENLGICEGLYFMWSATYKVGNGQPRVFIGQPRLILPTKRTLPNGQIEQAQCAEPPGPEV